MPLLNELRTQGREASPTFCFLDDYLQKVSTPFKLYLNASRHAIFDVYEYSRSLFLPFSFASNRTIYARYMPYLVLHMQRLPHIVRQSFNCGHFMAKITQGNPGQNHCIGNAIIAITDTNESEFELLIHEVAPLASSASDIILLYYSLI